MCTVKNLHFHLFSINQDMFIFDYLCTDEVLVLMTELIEKCTTMSYISDLATNAYLESGEHDTHLSWLRYILADGLFSLLLTSFQKFISTGETAEEDKKAVGKMAWAVLNNIVVCHQKIK